MKKRLISIAIVAVMIMCTLCECAFAAGGWAKSGSDWVYYDSNGQKHLGWLQEGGNWYCFDVNTGAMLRDGFWTINGAVYAFDVNGKMITGSWFERDGIWYFANGNGTLANGWVQIGKDWYYFVDFYTDDNGNKIGCAPYMAQSQVWIFGNASPYEVYCFDKSGVMVKNNWHYQQGYWFFCGSDGNTKRGWNKIGKNWYYFELEYGEMKAGCQVEMSDGYTYAFDQNGVMVTGWYYDGGEWYYFKNDGTKAVYEWVKSGGNYYYMYNEGKMARDIYLNFNGTVYYFDGNGVASLYK